MPIVSGGGGGGSSFSPVGVVLQGAALDIHAAGVHYFTWNAAFDNPWDFNPIGALPAGIGFANPLDGTSSNLITTVRGTFAVVAFFTVGAADANIRGTLACGIGDAGGNFGPFVVTGGTIERPTVVDMAAQLPAGTNLRVGVNVDVAAAAGAYNATPTVCISRLA